MSMPLTAADKAEAMIREAKAATIREAKAAMIREVKAEATIRAAVAAMTTKAILLGG